MIVDLVQKVSQVYGLGEVLSQSVQIHGGLLHKMWQIETSKGKFALKILNPEIINKEGVLDEYVVSEEITEQVQNAGIDSVFARRSTSKLLIEKIDDQQIILYPWIEGTTLKPHQVLAKHVEKIGKVVALLHSIKLDAKELKTSEIKFVSIDQWKELLTQIALKELSWKNSFSSLLPKVLELTPLIVKGLEKMTKNQVISHRDLDPKNVIWVESQPFLIDWESVGFVNPGQELASLALDWSEGTNQEHFSAMIKAYRQIKQIEEQEIVDGLLGSLNNKLRWLEFNIRRSLGIVTQDQGEISLGNAQCIKTIKDIEKSIKSLEVYREWIREL